MFWVGNTRIQNIYTYIYIYIYIIIIINRISSIPDVSGQGGARNAEDGEPVAPLPSRCSTVSERTFNIIVEINK